MTLEKLHAGLTVFKVKRSANAFRSGKWDVWPVHIKKVDVNQRTVLASWNGNPPNIYQERDWSKWRLKEPKE